MGHRELRRVPLDFAWPIGKVWGGYLNPHHAEHPDCPDCYTETCKAAEAWTETPPPDGDGYQLWETTSEGSPVSPVFATLDALCEYAAEHCTTFASFRASVEEWRRMLDAGHVAHVETMPNGITAVF